jgi:hypothetical protein
MARVTIITYKFSPPPLINESDFYAIKKALASNLNYEIEPSLTFKDQFPFAWWLFRITLVTGPIAGLIGLAKPKADSFLDYFGAACMFPLIITIFTLVMNAQTFISFNSLLRDKKEYYNRLKVDISKTNSYEEFLNLRRR